MTVDLPVFFLYFFSKNYKSYDIQSNFLNSSLKTNKFFKCKT